MKTTLIIALLMLAGVCAQQTYQLVWQDEFDGNALDTSKWQYEVNCDGGGNAEMQCYTNSGKNVQVNNGTLKIKILRENGGNGKTYSSGRINTAKSASWKYGRFEARAKLPNGIYLWPALWMMPRDSVYGSWAASGEIDIMENHGGQNTEHSSTLHFGGGWPKNIYASSGSKYESFDLTKDFHVYSATWTSDSIQFALDGNVFHTQTLQQSFNNAGAGSNPYTKNGSPFDQNFYYIINCAVGGGFFGGNSQALTAAQSAAWGNPVFEIDYVRAYQLKDGVVVSPVPAPAPAPAPTPSTGSAGSSANCQALFNSLQCRTATNDLSQLDASSIDGARNWLCGGYPQYCADISDGGKYSGCNSAEQLSYAMNLYYADYSGDQGAGACNFGGLGSTYTTSAPTPTAAPTTSAATSSCQTLFDSLKCRTSTNDITKLDTTSIQGTRDWLCGGYPQYCTDIVDGGKYSGCNSAEQLSYAMNLYYADYSGDQGDGACNFGGLGFTRTTSAPSATSSPCSAGQTVCQDANQGATCYVTGGPYTCVTRDDGKSQLCPTGTSGCGNTCYLTSQYTCTNGWLSKK